MDTITTQIIEAGGVATALVAIFVFVRRIMAPVRKLHYFLDDWFGTEARPGVPPRLGVMSRLDAIEHELHPNSSLSMRDVVDRIEKAVREGNLINAMSSTPVTVQVTQPGASGLPVLNEHDEGDEDDGGE